MLAATALAVAAAGCDTDEPGPAATSAGGAPGAAAGMISWALHARPRSLDPLYARSPGEQLVTRQIHEPLVAELTAPFDAPRRAPGVAISVSSSSDAALWRLRLRPAVRFGDGAALNSQAVLANADRWQSSATARGLLGEFLADAPRPDLVRFILRRPDPGFAERLAAPALGLVSPRALERAGGAEIAPTQLSGTGTGPFALRERSAERLVLARQTGWWGADRGLGPGIDQLEVVAIPEARDRLAELVAGSIQVASRLGPAQARAVRRDPLLTVFAEPGRGALGIERSVRGIPEGEPAPALNGVWRTGIDAG